MEKNKKIPERVAWGKLARPLRLVRPRFGLPHGMREDISCDGFHPFVGMEIPPAMQYFKHKYPLNAPSTSKNFRPQASSWSGWPVARAWRPFPYPVVRDCQWSGRLLEVKKI